MNFNSNLMMKPMIIGGVVGGIISGIPILSCLNCCCLMFIASGAITAHLILEKAKVEMEDLAIAGAGAGVIAGFISGVLSFIFNMFINTASLLGQYGGEDMAMNIGASAGVGIIGIPIAIILGGIFGAIGAVLYYKLKEK